MCALSSAEMFSSGLSMSVRPSLRPRGSRLQQCKALQSLAELHICTVPDSQVVYKTACRARKSEASWQP